MPPRLCLIVAATLCAPAFAALAQTPPVRQLEPNTLVPAGVVRYAASGFPDRIVATPLQDAAQGFAVSWRTDANVNAPVLEIALAKDSPDQWDGNAPPRRIAATTRVLAAGNGVAHHHHAVVDGLQAGMLYAWRVQGRDTWSAWRQLRTAASAGTPVQILYMGDTQNQNLSLVTRVMHEAVRHAPQANLVLFAGDLVNKAVDDDEWGEWFDATAALSPTMAFAPTSGNHEFFNEHQGTPQARLTLGEQWKAHFALPGNGTAGMEASTYWFDYQGIRFAVLDGTSAISHDSGPAQAQWLDGVLAGNPHRWSIVLIHQPIYSPIIGRDNVQLQKHLQPVIERHRVDLVLQGHDHTYGRRSGERGQTPVYLVSVAGPKQYRLSPQARRSMSPVGEDTQLFQVLRLNGGRLDYEARTATGRLYDAFTLVDGGGSVGKRLLERSEGRIQERNCPRDATLKGREDRCWE